MMKKRFMKVLCICMVLALSAALFGCKSSTSNKSNSSSGKKLVFGDIAYDMTDTWNLYSVQAFQYAAKQKGVDTIVLDSQNKLDKSVSCMQELINKKVDGISIFPISPDQGATLAKMANAAKIPVTIENLKLTDTSAKIISTVACQYDDIGYAAIKYIATKWPNANVLFVGGAPGGGVLETYQIGINKALKEYEGKITLVATLNGNWATEPAMNVTQSFIQSGKKFDVIFANNGLEAQGCYNALKEANLVGKVPIVSTGGSPQDLQMMQSGQEDANMSAPVCIQGIMSFNNLWDNANGKTPTTFEPLPIIPVDKDTLATAIKWNDYSAALKYISSLK
jgi:ABC-type sugar transport system substrate-binding protein